MADGAGGRREAIRQLAGFCRRPAAADDAGRAYTGTRVLLLACDLHVRIIDAATGELLRDLAPGLARNYQPTGKPKGGPRQRKPRTQ